MHLITDKIKSTGLSMGEIEFGVVIATSMKRNELLINRSLRSVLNQSLGPDFIVIIDDNDDQDNFNNLMSSVAASGGDGIFLIKNQYTKAMSGTGAWNTGVDYLKGKFKNPANAYVAILDDDDEWIPDYLQNCYQSILKSGVEHTQAVFSKLRRIHKEFSLDMHLTYFNLNITEFLIGNPGVQGSNMVFKLSAFEKAGRFDETLCSSTDRDLMIRFLQQFQPDSVAIVENLSVLHYADSEQTVTNNKANKHEGLDRFYEKFIRLYSNEILQQSLSRAEQYFSYPGRDKVESLYRKNKTVLITGVCGFIGSFLANELVESGYQVYGVDNLSSGSLERLKYLIERTNFQFIECDLTVENEVINLFEKESFDFVYHLAALPRVNFSFDYPAESYQANVTATAYIANTLKNHTVQRLIFTSSSSVYGNRQAGLIHEDLPLNPLSPYAQQKQEAENILRNELTEGRTDCVILRLFNVYGYNSLGLNTYSTLIHRWMIEMLEQKNPVIYGDGSHTRDFTYIDDVIKALKSCIEHYKKESNPEIINIGCSDSIRIKDVFAKLAMLLNFNKLPDYKSARYPEPAHTRADHSKATRILGWQPGVFFDEGLKKTVDTLRGQEEIVIGMALHNGAGTIRRAVMSVIRQKDVRRKIRLVIVNDCSTDNWQSEIEDLISDAIVIENVNFRSVCSTRNFMNEYILKLFPTAGLIGRLDADDELAHDKVLSEVEDIIETKNPDVIIAGNLLRCNNQIIERKNCPTPAITDERVLLERLEMMAKGIAHAELPSCNILLKPKALLSYPQQVSAEDHWLTVEYILNKDKYNIHVAENLIYAIYSLSGNLTAQNKKKDAYIKSRKELYQYAYIKIHGDEGSKNQS